MPVGSTSRRSVQVLGFASIGPLTPPCRLYPLPVRQASALPTASSRFRLATDTLAVRLTLPLAGCVEDFHLQVSAPCRAHRKKRLGKTPSRFHRSVTSLFTTKLFQPRLTALQVASHSFRLEVPVFHRAGADARSAAQTGCVLGAYDKATLFRQQGFFNRSQVRVVGIGFGNGPVVRTTGVT